MCLLPHVLVHGVPVGVFRAATGRAQRHAGGDGLAAGGADAPVDDLGLVDVEAGKPELRMGRNRTLGRGDFRFGGIEHRHALGASTERGDRRSFALYVRESEASKARTQDDAERKRQEDSARAEQAELDKLRRDVALQREREAILASAPAAAPSAPVAAVVPVAVAPSAPPAPAAPVVAEPASDQGELIASLGDLTQYSVEELTSIAQELGLDQTVLLSKQKVQSAIKRAKAGA